MYILPMKRQAPYNPKVGNDCYVIHNIFETKQPIAVMVQLTNMINGDNYVRGMAEKRRIDRKENICYIKYSTSPHTISSPITYL